MHTTIIHLHTLINMQIRRSLSSLHAVPSHWHTHTHTLTMCQINSAAVHSIYLLIELLRENIIGCKMSGHTGTHRRRGGVVYTYSQMKFTLNTKKQLNTSSYIYHHINMYILYSVWFVHVFSLQGIYHHGKMLFSLEVPVCTTLLLQHKCIYRG